MLYDAFAYLTFSFLEMWHCAIFLPSEEISSIIRESNSTFCNKILLLIIFYHGVPKVRISFSCGLQIWSYFQWGRGIGKNRIAFYFRQLGFRFWAFIMYRNQVLIFCEDRYENIKINFHISDTEIFIFIFVFIFLFLSYFYIFIFSHYFLLILRLFKVKVAETPTFSLWIWTNFS